MRDGESNYPVSLNTIFFYVSVSGDVSWLTCQSCMWPHDVMCWGTWCIVLVSHEIEKGSNLNLISSPTFCIFLWLQFYMFLLFLTLSHLTQLLFSLPWLGFSFNLLSCFISLFSLSHRCSAPPFSHPSNPSHCFHTSTDLRDHFAFASFTTWYSSQSTYAGVEPFWKRKKKEIENHTSSP